MKHYNGILPLYRHELLLHTRMLLLLSTALFTHYPPRACVTCIACPQGLRRPPPSTVSKKAARPEYALRLAY